MKFSATVICLGFLAVTVGASSPSDDELQTSCICTREYRPVCYHGVTYGNRCMAKCFGAPGWLIQDGACRRRLRSGGLLPVSESSVVTEEPQLASMKRCLCTKEYAPVCYRDVEYANRCVAKCHGAVDALLRPGHCRRRPGYPWGRP